MSAATLSEFFVCFVCFVVRTHSPFAVLLFNTGQDVRAIWLGVRVERREQVN
jgi:hypothetical protein